MHELLRVNIENEVPFSVLIIFYSSVIVMLV